MNTTELANTVTQLHTTVYQALQEVNSLLALQNNNQHSHIPAEDRIRKLASITLSAEQQIVEIAHILSVGNSNFNE